MPDVCCPCCAGLVIPHPQPYYRHQVFEIPPRHYTITEYQLFAGACTNCGEKVKTTLPDTAPSGQMGPN
ncbi:IS66 family transposase zinc-finger binding domain-containing protein [Motilimonas sp. 1_MG-2023]|uniref:IS66 family transposase zinc-finger binding domain-containing protein n=1 Tax=Motilimonas sp. 1_MG-2023 TaxID=3062672 RepID=UPI0034E049A2